ncbi:MAG TPA: nicotinamide riboside transporter PnuC [Steroidobacteraceae bacterium]|nr:nicotinamide riboside transporter PnuC [Steroidobacteraceae bacterium]
MAEFLQGLSAELAASGSPEWLAVFLGLAYLILAARLSLWCWPAAFVSSAIYLALFFERQLYQQALLQVFYVVMAVYGFAQWRRGLREPGEPVHRWSLRQHALAIGAIALLTIVTGALEARYTDAPMPYLDAFTTWGSVLTTWMVTRRVLENWLYWIVVDGVLVHVALASGLIPTAGLFLVYIGIVIAGYFSWRRLQLRHSPVAA